MVTMARGAREVNNEGGLGKEPRDKGAKANGEIEADFFAVH
jgi:hypothetical protein